MSETGPDLNRSENKNIESSCHSTLSRSQFLERLVKKALLAGTLAAAPIIADSFIAPPMAAAQSGSGSASDAE